ncbi:alpha tubulin suppressor [Extremus antarcticus]|uniref:Alpha tubulin suppressor n=1 Tax=Extremus antarcticus TaxID=702011 RepID=A0AAJ0G6K0_9PEZI|nr:alpha tubulin suppressor [Extremus antarcticus]
MLYALGSNGSAQLGVGHTDDLSVPQPISTGGKHLNWKVKQFAAGGNHTVLLCDDGKVRVTGNNEDGRCGVQNIHRFKHFTELEMPRDASGNELKAVHVAANWSATTFVFDDGSVRTCGTGHSGELGLGPEGAKSSDLTRIAFSPSHGVEVIHIASGMSHTVAILSNGEVWGWGRGRRGQLGEPAEEVWAPRKIERIDFEAVKAVCGTDFTLLIGESSTGRIALLGGHRNDRFGIKSNLPTMVAGWSDVAASWCSILLLKASGDVVAWGRNDHGQLPPDDMPQIKAVAAGSEHCLAVTKSGSVLAWGWGEHGNCGSPTDERGDVKGRWNELVVPGRAVKVFAGCATSFIEVEEQDVADGG